MHDFWSHFILIIEAICISVCCQTHLDLKTIGQSAEVKLQAGKTENKDVNITCLECCDRGNFNPQRGTVTTSCYETSPLNIWPDNFHCSDWTKELISLLYWTCCICCYDREDTLLDNRIWTVTVAWQVTTERKNWIGLTIKLLIFFFFFNIGGQMHPE